MKDETARRKKGSKTESRIQRGTEFRGQGSRRQEEDSRDKRGSRRAGKLRKKNLPLQPPGA